MGHCRTFLRTTSYQPDPSQFSKYQMKSKKGGESEGRARKVFVFYSGTNFSHFDFFYETFDAFVGDALGREFFLLRA